MNAFLRNSHDLWQRTFVFAAVCVIHVLVFLAFANSLTRRAATTVFPSIQIVVVNEHKTQETPQPSMRVPILLSTPIQIAPPNIDIEESPAPPLSASSPGASSAPDSSETAAAQSSVGTPMTFVSAPASDEYYPRAARERHEQGIVLMAICVDSAAEIVSVDVIKSSGYQRLDAAAVVVGHKTRWKLAKVENKSSPSCAQFYVKFAQE